MYVTVSRSKFRKTVYLPIKRVYFVAKKEEIQLTLICLLLDH